MNITRSTEKQAEIDRKKTSAAAGYPSLWMQMLSEWQRPETSDRAWLLYSANYILTTAGIRWALDPLTLHQRLPSAPEVDASPLAALDVIVLTHRHTDHLDLDLLRRLRRFPVRWIIPEFLLDFLTALDLPPENVSIPHPLEPLHMGGLTLIPFDSLHWEADPSYPGGRRGVPALGYLAEFSGKRWLFPGDTRTYDASSLLRLGPVDGLVVHLWLGRGCALENQFALLEPFGRFCLALQPERIVVAHLNEFGRLEEDTWNTGHFQIVQKWLKNESPRIEVESAVMGNSVDL
jgi:L-ascorbate metabolism protein UlaG (beta-lactamase superfamily)